MSHLRFVLQPYPDQICTFPGRLLIHDRRPDLIHTEWGVHSCTMLGSIAPTVMSSSLHALTKHALSYIKSSSESDDLWLVLNMFAWPFAGDFCGPLAPLAAFSGTQTPVLGAGCSACGGSCPRRPACQLFCLCRLFGSVPLHNRYIVLWLS